MTNDPRHTATPNAFDIRTNAMPAEMQLLLRDYPRDSWQAHPGFSRMTQNWLGAHLMFRRLANVLEDDTAAFLDRNLDDMEFAGRLGRYGNALVQNLHGHHHFEDHDYFPELSAADPRFDRGIEILEADHLALNTVLDALTETGNRTIKLIQLDPQQARDEAGRLHEVTGAIGKFLERHLGDEEELAVPIILHHRLRG